MQSQKWSIPRSAVIGAIAGPALLLLKPYVLGGRLPSDPAELTGYLLGGAVFGAIVFPVVALIRNMNAG